MTMHIEENIKKITYSYAVKDSVITFERGFDMKTLGAFRDQKLNLSLAIPYNKLTQLEQARRTARAILATEQRARDGYAAVSTAKRQIKQLMAQAAAAGLAALVVDVLPTVAAGAR